MTSSDERALVEYLEGPGGGDLASWVAGFERWGRPVQIRAALAALEHAMQAHGITSEGLYGGRAVDAVREWLSLQTRDARREVEEAAERAHLDESLREALAISSEAAAVIAAARSLALAVGVDASSARQRVAAAARGAAALTSEAAVRGAVRQRLLEWLRGADDALPATPPEQSQRLYVWIGNTSPGQVRDYLREQYDDDEAPLSAFADEFLAGHYDHDWIETTALERAVPVLEFLAPYAGWGGLAGQVGPAAARLGLETARVLIVGHAAELAAPSEEAGAKSPTIDLIFLGGFDAAPPARGRR